MRLSGRLRLKSSDHTFICISRYEYIDGFISIKLGAIQADGVFDQKWESADGILTAVAPALFVQGDGWC